MDKAIFPHPHFSLMAVAGNIKDNCCS